MIFIKKVFVVKINHKIYVFNADKIQMRTLNTLKDYGLSLKKNFKGNDEDMLVTFLSKVEDDYNIELQKLYVLDIIDLSYYRPFKRYRGDENESS